MSEKIDVQAGMDLILMNIVLTSRFEMNELQMRFTVRRKDVHT